MEIIFRFVNKNFVNILKDVDMYRDINVQINSLLLKVIFTIKIKEITCVIK